MPAIIEVYYDFRSPYAYFTSQRIRGEAIAKCNHVWKWRPVSIDILLNLQAGREPWAPYVDTLAPPKRAHLMADVRRLAERFKAPIRPPNPPRPNSVPALCLAALIDEHERPEFNVAVFHALWQRQQDISAPDVLASCLVQAGARAELLDIAFGGSTRARLADDTVDAYGRGIFGVPTFVCENEIFFGDDRLDLLLWSIERRLPASS